jgi:hypothetical protein
MPRTRARAFFFARAPDARRGVKKWALERRERRDSGRKLLQTVENCRACAKLVAILKKKA